MNTYLNGRNAHVNANLVLSHFFEGGHSEANVVEVFDWSSESLRQVGNEVKYLLHLRSILLVTEFPVVELPSLDLGYYPDLQFLYETEKNI